MYKIPTHTSAYRNNNVEYIDMTAESGSTDFSDFFYEYPYGSPFITAEDIFLQNVLLSVPPPTLSNFTYQNELVDNPPGMGSSQGIALNPSLPPHYDSTPPSFSPQIVAPVNDEARLCPIYPVSTPPLPPIPASQAAPLFPSNWRKIPQQVYDHGKKQWDFQPSEPILFHVNGHLGVNMGDALRKKFTGLDGRDDLILQDARHSISCRLWFPGYPLNTSTQIFTRYWNKNRDPITRSTLAYHVARKLEHYLDSMASSHSIDGSTHEQWEIGKGFMQLDNMFLVQLEPVSCGSFQPEIWVLDRTT